MFSHFRILIRYLHELHGDELESLLFEPLDDVTDEAAVDAVGLDHDEGPLAVGHGEAEEETGGIQRGGDGATRERERSGQATQRCQISETDNFKRNE